MTENKLLALLEEGGKRPSELAASLGMSGQDVRKLLTELARAGAVRRQGPWWVLLDARKALHLPDRSPVEMAERDTRESLILLASRETPAEDLDVAIFDTLKARGPLNLRELYAELKGSVELLRQRVEILYAHGRLTRTRIEDRGISYVFDIPAQTLAPATPHYISVIDNQEYEIKWNGRGPLPGSSDAPGLGSSLSTAVGHKVHL